MPYKNNPFKLTLINVNNLEGSFFIRNFASSNKIKTKSIMIGNFKSTVKGHNFILFDIKKSNHDFIELINGFSTFTEFMERFHVSAKWIEEQFINNNRIDMNDLFDYSIIKTNFLVEKNGVYYERCKIIEGKPFTKKEYYDVYVGVSRFASLTLNVLAGMAMRKHYPKMFEKPFTKTVEFDQSILDLTMDTNVVKWCNSNLESKRYTFGDIFKLVNDVKEGVNGKEVSQFTIYADGSVFIPINGDYSAYFNASDFFNKDWDSVLNRHIFSVPNEHQTKENKWYKGKQGDYFAFKNSELIKKIKEIFF